MSIFMINRTFPSCSEKPERKPSRRYLGLIRDRRCVVSVEFAILAVPFFAMMLGLMEMGYDLYTQAVLDTVVAQAARQIQVGNVVGYAGETSAELAKLLICPNLHGWLVCQNITVGVEPLPTVSATSSVQQDYYTARDVITYTAASGTTATGGQITTGCGGQMMLLAAWYNGPTFVGRLIPLFGTVVNINGASQRVHVTYATAGFVNEYFSGGQGTCSTAQNP